MVDTAVAIRDEQVRQLYRQSRTVFLPNLVAMPAIVYALWDAFPHSVLLGWGAALYFVTAVRALAVWLGGRRERKGAESLRWGWLLAVLNMVSGSVWGVGAFLFVGQADPLAQAFFIIMLAAMVAGAVASFSPFYPAYALFALPCVGPVVVRAMLEWAQNPGRDARIYLLLGIVAVVFLAVHLVFARTNERALIESIKLRFEKLDLVEQLTVQKELAEAANIAKSRFLAAASHDLRQPMHALGLFIDALRSESHPPATSRIVESVTESHVAACALLENILEFSRVEAGIIKPAFESIPVQRVLDQMRTEYALQASAADLELRVIPSSAHVRTDPVLLARLLGNFVSNAIRYTEQGRVVIGCRRERRALRIEVHDTGIGIPPEEHQAVFREFYQVDSGARRRRRNVGMGLGLAIVSGLAAALDHAVRVASTPGKGSAFSVRLPLADAATVGAPAYAQVADDLAGRTVLVIDDEPAIRDAVCEVLRRWKVRPIAASSAAEALAALRARGGTPDAIVVDYQLEGGKTGLDAIAQIDAALGVTIPAIIVTGDTQPERLREASAQGRLLLHKPLAPMRLRAALTSVLQAAPKPARAAQQPSVARI